MPNVQKREEKTAKVLLLNVIKAARKWRESKLIPTNKGERIGAPPIPPMYLTGSLPRSCVQKKKKENTRKKNEPQIFYFKKAGNF